MNPRELKGALEAIIYAADDPATLDHLAAATGAGREEIRAALEEMIAGCQAEERGIEIRRVARGYKYSTKPQHHEVVRQFMKSLRPPVRLSMPALETLAVVAYKQPITQPEIQEIRGVNCAGVIQTLLEKRLVTTAGRKAVIGRPILYRTTKEFLVRFGLNDVDELPSLKEFEQLAREALGPEGGIEIVAEESESGPGSAPGQLQIVEPAAGEGAEAEAETGASFAELSGTEAGAGLANPSETADVADEPPRPAPPELNEANDHRNAAEPAASPEDEAGESAST